GGTSAPGAARWIPTRQPPTDVQQSCCSPARYPPHPWFSSRFRYAEALSRGSITHDIVRPHQPRRSGRGAGHLSGSRSHGVAAMSVTATTHVGKPYLGLTNTELAAGRGTFVSDIQLPGMVYAAVLRSPHANA